MPTAPDATLDATRIAAIRERYACGAYDTMEVVQDLARRLLERGDV